MEYVQKAVDTRWTVPWLTRYQFLLRSSDADVERYLKTFTFVPSSAISTLMAEHDADPGQRKAQHLLASEVLEMVHGLDEAEKTRAEHQMMRSPSLTSLSSQSRTTSGEEPSEQDVNRINLPESQVFNTSLAHVLFYAGLAKSKSEGSRMLDKGGVYVASKSDSADLNFAKIDSTTANNAASLLVDNMLILRLGKWKVRVIEVVGNDQSQHQKTTSAHSNG